MITTKMKKKHLSRSPAPTALTLTDVLAAEKRDAKRYRWLRDRLAIEDIERIERDFFGTPEEHESVKTDIAVDNAMAANA